MLGKLYTRWIDVISLRTIYHILASLVAISVVATWVSVVATWVGFAQPRLTSADGDGKLASMGDTPLAAIYRFLGVFDIPRDWAGTADQYLNDHLTAAFIIGAAAFLIGIGALLYLDPAPDAKVPSMQASTWWLCVAVLIQTGFTLPGLWMPVVLAVGVAVVLVIQRKTKAVGWVVVQLAVAAAFIGSLPFVLIFHEAEK